MTTESTDNRIRLPAEEEYKEELIALAKADKLPHPPGWNLSPAAVLTYLTGGKAGNKTISPKYLGDKRLLELCLATLLTDRALLLTGLPGTAKTWLSEHLAAAISGNTHFMIQGSIGIDEQAIRYSWNYALLLQKGNTPEALIKSPVMRAMEAGSLCRIEELTRLPTEIQDVLISVLSEKVIYIPELNSEVYAQRGFNCIATANDRDKGIHELSAALRRRFNIVALPMPASLEEEVEIITFRLNEINQQQNLAKYKIELKPIRELITIFRELRNGHTEDKKQNIKSPGSTLSTAEILSVLQTGIHHSIHFGSGSLRAADLAGSALTTIVKDPKQDLAAWNEYLETILKKRKDFSPWYDELKR
jgi:MoxR-like ATPase